MGKSYGFLKTASLVFRVLAWVILVLLVVVGIATIVTGGTEEMPRWTGLIFLVLGAWSFFQLFTFGSVIRLLLDVAQRGNSSTS